MRALRILIASALAAGIALVPAAALAEPSASVRSVDDRGFPVVRLTLSTADGFSLRASDVTVTENGLPVHVLGAESLDGSGRQVDAVLAIDVSNSMRGPKLVTALAAARTFLQGVPPSIPVGILSFSSAPVIDAPVSSERVSAEAAVGSLSTATGQGTALYRAVMSGAGMFGTEASAQHTLILLTDGKNTDASTTVEQAVTAAKSAGVSVYTISLAGSDTNELVLRELASRTGGRFQAITPEDLGSVYAGLAGELSHQFVISYRSKAPYGAPVSVNVGLPVGSASTRFLAPGISAAKGDRAGTAAPAPQAPLSGGGAIVVVAMLSFLAALSLGWSVRESRERARREAQLRSRLSSEVGPEGPAELGDHANPWIPGSIAQMAERAVGSGPVGSSLKRRLTRAGWNLRVGELTAMVIVAAAGAGVGGYLAFGGIGLLLAVAGALVPLALLSVAASKRLAGIQAQLPDLLMVIASSLRAGHSFLQSLDSAAREIGDPASAEFRRTMSEIRLGRETGEALDALVERIGSRDLEWTVTAIKIQRRIGGNLAEVLEGVAGTVRERETLRRQVKVLSAEGRISTIVLTVLPLALGLYLSVVNPDYLHVLTGTRAGNILLGVSAALMVVGYAWMRKIVRLDDV